VKVRLAWKAQKNMVIIHASKDVRAGPDRIWDIVSDIEREPEFWHGTKSIQNIKQAGNIVEREVGIAFKNSKCREVVKLDHKKSISIEILEDE
jgi:ribosome-associated toxin RatA of RatAB toxin-antitoxin module